MKKIVFSSDDNFTSFLEDLLTEYYSNLKEVETFKPIKNTKSKTDKSDNYIPWYLRDGYDYDPNDFKYPRDPNEFKDPRKPKYSDNSDDTNTDDKCKCKECKECKCNTKTETKTEASSIGVKKVITDDNKCIVYFDYAGFNRDDIKLSISYDRAVLTATSKDSIVTDFHTNCQNTEGEVTLTKTFIFPSDFKNAKLSETDYQNGIVKLVFERYSNNGEKISI